MKSVPFYRFLSDGATADITVLDDTPTIVLPYGEGKKAYLSIHEDHFNSCVFHFLSFQGPPRYRPGIESRVRGLYLALEMRLRFRGGSIVETRKPDSSVVSLPLWVSDQEWSQRFDVDPVKEGEDQDVYYFFGDRLRISRRKADSPIGADRWRFVSSSTDYRNSFQLWSNDDSLQKTFDDTMKMFLYAPESDKPLFPVARGEFVDPDEIELYRALGEPIPMLWKTEDLSIWIEQRTS